MSLSGSRVPAREFSASRKDLEDFTTKLPRLPTFRRGYFSANASLYGSKKSLYKAALALVQVQGEGKAFNIYEINRGFTQKPPTPISIDNTSKTPRRGIEDIRNRGRTTDPNSTLPIADRVIPLDASSRLSSISSTLSPMSIRRLFTVYLSLSKPRLSFLMVLTTAAAYSIYPVPAVLIPSSTVSPSLSVLSLVFLTGGTALCSASANALNMLMEPEHDAKMSRTRNRPLVRGLIGKRGAFTFAAVAGVIGVGGLWFGVNPTVAFLGGLNIFLYAGVYTPMKRISVVNTWIGAVVGGIPPLMGWAAAAGQSATGNGGWEELLLGRENIGGWLLAALLFAWQFPHFNALSWTIRDEYKNAGYRMLAWTNPKMNGRVALRYSLLFFPICVGLTWYGVTDQGFLVTSSILNTWIVRKAWIFWRLEGQKGSARGLFWAGVWHLPVIMVLAMAHKKGLWEGVWKSMVGDEDEEDVWLDEDEQPDEVEAKSHRTLTPLSGSAT